MRAEVQECCMWGRIGVKFVGERSEMEDIKKANRQKHIGRGEEGGSWESLSVFLNFNSSLWAPADLHTAPARQNQCPKFAFSLLSCLSSIVFVFFVILNVSGFMHAFKDMQIHMCTCTCM